MKDTSILKNGKRVLVYTGVWQVAEYSNGKFYVDDYYVCEYDCHSYQWRSEDITDQVKDWQEFPPAPSKEVITPEPVIETPKWLEEAFVQPFGKPV
jgi:hypothetical protein